MGSKAYDTFWGSLLKVTTKGHTFIHRASGGRIGKKFPGGGQIVWISTLGRRSGEWRTNPLLGVPDSDAPDASWVVTGSNAGQAKVPGWVYNVQANPDGFVEVAGEKFPVRFEQAEGADRDALYARLTTIWSGYSMYEVHAGRDIPVFRLIRTTP